MSWHTWLSEMLKSVALQTSNHFHPSLSPVVSLSLGILHEWMRTQMLAKPSSNLLQKTGGDHRGSHAQPGWGTFTTTCLRWILGYMRLEIWCKIGLSGDWRLCTRRGACYYWTGWHMLLTSAVLFSSHYTICVSLPLLLLPISIILPPIINSTLLDNGIVAQHR